MKTYPLAALAVLIAAPALAETLRRKPRPPLLAPASETAPSPPREASEPPRPKAERHLTPWPAWRRGRIDFDKADVRDVAKFISEITGKNIILSDKARGGKLTIFSPARVSRAEAYQAFLAALEVNHLTVVASGSFLKIVPQRDASQMPIATHFDPKRAPRDERMITVILPVRHGDAKEIGNVVGQLRSKNGMHLVYAPTGTLVIADVAANIRRLTRIVAQLDVPVGKRDRVWMVRLLNATASEVVERLNQLLVDKGAPRKGAVAPTSRDPAARAPAAATVAGEPLDEGDLAVTRMIADDRTNQILVLASEQSYLRVLAIIARLDGKLEHEEGRVHVHSLEHAEAEAIAAVLANLAAGGSGARPTSSAGRAGARPGAKAPSSAQAAAGSLFDGEIRVSAEKSTNSLVIVAGAKDFARLRRVIDRLDVPRRQVFVEAVILEVSETYSRELGVAMNGGTTLDVGGTQVPLFGGTTFGKLSSIALDPTALTGLAAVMRGPDLAGTKGLLGTGVSVPAFGLVIKALQSTNDVNVLSTPHILASDNEEAEIVVGQNVPFITGGGYSNLAGAATGATGVNLASLANIGGFPNIQRQDVALTLKVTPQINTSGFVRLKVEQEVQDLAGDDPLRGPTTTKRRAKTTVVVRDQQTVVLGGLIRDNVTEDINKVPFLGDIPLIGHLFRNTVKRKEKRNLLLFLTPYVVREPADFARIFKQKMREREDFLERFAAKNNGYRASIDYEKRFGLLEHVHQTVERVERDELEEARTKTSAKERAAKEKEDEIVRGEEVRPAAPERRRKVR